MSDEIIREFSRNGTGSPITKLELDVLNVAREKGAKVYIDDVLQINSPLNDGRRAHIDLQGDVLDFNVNLANAPFTDNFNAIDTDSWLYLIDFYASHSFSDGYWKVLFNSGTQYNRITAILRKAGFIEDFSISTKASIRTPGVFNQEFTPQIFLQAQDSGWNTKFNLEIILLNGTGSGRVVFKIPGVVYTQSITAYPTDWFELEIIHDNSSMQTKTIIKRNDIEVINRIDITSHISGELFGRVGLYSSGQGEIWFDWYKENI